MLINSKKNARVRMAPMMASDVYARARSVDDIKNATIDTDATVTVSHGECCCTVNVSC